MGHTRSMVLACVAMGLAGCGQEASPEWVGDGPRVRDAGARPEVAREGRCGDGVQDDGEACDDGNRQSGDGCSVRCAVEATGPRIDGEPLEPEIQDDAARAAEGVCGREDRTAEFAPGPVVTLQVCAITYHNQGARPVTSVDEVREEFALANAYFDEAGAALVLDLVHVDQVEAEVATTDPVDDDQDSEVIARAWRDVERLHPGECQISVAFINEARWGGKGRYPWSGTQSAWVARSNVGDGDSLAHEIGHVLGLRHTHDANGDGCADTADDANCGDGQVICDAECPDGSLPPSENVMSYYHCDVPQAGSFSACQVRRARCFADRLFSLCLGDACDPGVCEDVVAVEVGATEGTVAAPGGLAGSCGGAGGEVVHAFTAPAAGRWSLSTEGSDFDTVLYVTTACGAGRELACNDDAVGLLSAVEVDLARGQTVYVVVDAYDEAGGDYRLTIERAEECGPARAERRCVGGHPFWFDGCGARGDQADVCGATEVCEAGACRGGPDACDGVAPAPVGISGGAVASPGTLSGSCGGAGGEVVRAFTAPATGRWSLSTEGSAFDTVLYVTTACGGGRELACNDDSGGLQSAVEVELERGQTVFVVIDTFERAGGGEYRLTIGPAEPACAPRAEICNGRDDDCDGRVDEGGVCDQTRSMRFSASGMNLRAGHFGGDREYAGHPVHFRCALRLSAGHELVEVELSCRLREDRPDWTEGRFTARGSSRVPGLVGLGPGVARERLFEFTTRSHGFHDVRGFPPELEHMRVVGDGPGDDVCNNRALPDCAGLDAVSIRFDVVTRRRP